MPLSPILDAHVHQWDPRTTPRETTIAVKLFGWNPRLMEWVVRRAIPKPLIDFVAKAEHALNPYLPAQLNEDWGPHAPRIEGVVHVQAGWKAKRHHDLVDETRWLERIDPEGETIRAIVGAAHLEASDLDAVLDAHVASSSRFRGVRDMLAAHADPSVVDWARPGAKMNSPAWRKGYVRLGERGLSFDAWMYHHQLDDFRALAKAYPDTPVVLCHLGSPVGIGGPYAALAGDAADRERVENGWREAFVRLCELDHLRFKISGILMPIMGFGAEKREQPMPRAELVDRLGPLVRFAIETAGIDRCMFGSNFPMDKVSVDYVTLIEAYDELLVGYDEAERNGFWRDNARAFYRIDG